MAARIEIWPDGEAVKATSPCYAKQNVPKNEAERAVEGAIPSVILGSGGRKRERDLGWRWRALQLLA
jgi:hypothetical protein